MQPTEHFLGNSMEFQSERNPLSIGLAFEKVNHME